MATSLWATSSLWSKNLQFSCIKTVLWACTLKVGHLLPWWLRPCSSSYLIPEGAGSLEHEEEGDADSQPHSQKHHEPGDSISPATPSVPPRSRRQMPPILNERCMCASPSPRTRQWWGWDGIQGWHDPGWSMFGEQARLSSWKRYRCGLWDRDDPFKVVWHAYGYGPPHTFSFCLLPWQKTFCLHRSEDAPATTLYPITLPSLGIFGRMTPGMSVRERRAIAVKRVVYLMIYALNYWYYNGPPPDISRLGRVPTSAHRRIHRRIENFVKSDSGMASSRVAKAGRRFPQLVARLGELSETMTRRGLGGDQYSKAFQGCDSSEPLDVPELCPFRDLQADRLRLFGRGHWDITNYLPDELVMAYREPRTILLDRTPEPWEYPRCNDPLSEIKAVATLWDGLDLLYVHDDPAVLQRPYEKVRIFNAYKSQEMDRQIGDRRGRNAVEHRLDGPSSCLPYGALLTDLVLCPRSETLRISVSDRKDFYHQIGCTPAKARCNTIGSLSAADLEGLKAFNIFLQQSALKKYNRLRDGDRLGWPKSVGLPFSNGSPSTFQVAFRGILQGDHGGVEFATAAHRQLLRNHGVLQEDEEITSRRASRSLQCMQGLVIDDFFAVSVESSTSLPEASRSKVLHHKAQEAYAQEAILGSPQKDVLAEDSARVIGAFLDSSRKTRKLGLVKVGVPPEKRYGLSWISLNVAQLRSTTDSLHLALIGGWVSALTYRRPMLGILNQAFTLVKNENYDPAAPKVLPLSRQVCDELVIAWLCWRLWFARMLVLRFLHGSIQQMLHFPWRQSSRLASPRRLAWHFSRQAGTRAAIQSCSLQSRGWRRMNPFILQVRPVQLHITMLSWRFLQVGLWSQPLWHPGGFQYLRQSNSLIARSSMWLGLMLCVGSAFWSRSAG